MRQLMRQKTRLIAAIAGQQLTIWRTFTPAGAAGPLLLAGSGNVLGRRDVV
jgi:hypothetical protein